MTEARNWVFQIHWSVKNEVTFMGLGMRKRTMISPIEIEIVKGMSLGLDCGGGDVICEDVEVGLVNLTRRGLEGGRV
jgi:hypothetical protein